MQHDLIACRHSHSPCPSPQRVLVLTPILSEARRSRVQPFQRVRCTERSRQKPFWPEHSKHSQAPHAGRMGRTKQRECRASAFSAIQHSDLATWTVISVCAASSQVLLCQHCDLCMVSDSLPQAQYSILCTQVIQVRTKLGSTVGSPILAIIAGLMCSMAGKQPVAWPIARHAGLSACPVRT